MQQYADIYSLPRHYMFRVSPHPLSGVLKTVSATSGVCHGNGTVTSFHRGLILTGVSETLSHQSGSGHGGRK